LYSSKYFKESQKHIQKLAPKKKIRYNRSNPNPNPPPICENPNLIPKKLRSQENQQNSASFHIDTPQQKFTQSELTAGKPQIHSAITVASSISPSVLQTISFTPLSTAHISTVIPVLPAVRLFSVNMVNRYAPLQLPTNLGAMSQDYQRKITFLMVLALTQHKNIPRR